ncbi:unnamed protein product, partial [marine sediment metagenome]
AISERSAKSFEARRTVGFNGLGFREFKGLEIEFKIWDFEDLRERNIFEF